MNSIPAFPCNELYDKHGVVHRSPGMTLRDYFAAKAMQAMLSSSNCPKVVDDEELAKQAYIAADAMLKARLK